LLTVTSKENSKKLQKVILLASHWLTYVLYIYICFFISKITFSC